MFTVSSAPTTYAGATGAIKWSSCPRASKFITAPRPCAPSGGATAKINRFTAINVAKKTGGTGTWTITHKSRGTCLYSVGRQSRNSKFYLKIGLDKSNPIAYNVNECWGTYTLEVIKRVAAHIKLRRLKV